jgi:hypothetical protein
MARRPPPRNNPSPERPETPAQRSDRNFAELLQELRVLQTGVQILFGFLLVFAVQPRFAELSQTSRNIYIVTLLGCCAAAGLLMAPVAYHRALFAQGRKEEIVRMADRSARAGMTALYVTMVGAALLVLNLVVSTGSAVALAAAVAVGIGSLWFAVPFYRRSRALGERPSR